MFASAMSFLYAISILCITLLMILFASRTRSVLTCTIRGLGRAAFAAVKIVAASFDAGPDCQLLYRRYYTRAFTSRPRFTSSCVYNSVRTCTSPLFIFRSFFRSPFGLRSIARLYCAAPLRRVFLPPSRSRSRVHCRPLSRSLTVGGVPRSASSSRRDVWSRRAPSAVGASAEGRRSRGATSSVFFFGTISPLSPRGLYVDSKFFARRNQPRQHARLSLVARATHRRFFSPASPTELRYVIVTLIVSIWLLTCFWMS